MGSKWFSGSECLPTIFPICTHVDSLCWVINILINCIKYFWNIAHKDYCMLLSPVTLLLLFSLLERLKFLCCNIWNWSWNCVILSLISSSNVFTMSVGRVWSDIDNAGWNDTEWVSVGWIGQLGLVFVVYFEIRKFYTAFFHSFYCIETVCFLMWLRVDHEYFSLDFFKTDCWEMSYFWIALGCYGFGFCNDMNMFSSV